MKLDVDKTERVPLETRFIKRDLKALDAYNDSLESVVFSGLVEILKLKDEQEAELRKHWILDSAHIISGCCVR